MSILVATIRTFIHDRISRRRFVLFGMALVGLAVLSSSPSSTRASNFVLIGSPLTYPVKIYGMASVYDRSPKSYEAFAVGEKFDALGNPLNEGVLLHYSGSGWSIASLPSGVKVLRAVGAARYLRTTDASNRTLQPPFYKWTTVAWAVGDRGTILKLDPFTGTWREQLKHKTASPERGCSEAELAVAGTPDCEPWTALDNPNTAGTENKNRDLRSIAVLSDRSAFIAGDDGAVFTVANGFQTLDGRTQWSDQWQYAAPNLFLDTHDIRALTFLDIDHGWLTGVDGTATPRLWRYRRQDGHTVIAATNAHLAGRQPTSIVATQRRTRSTADPLQDIVWIGLERSGTTEGYVVRYDEANNASAISPNFTHPIRSLSLTRQARGSGVNLIKNGEFTADRKDSNTGDKRMPDGWQIAARYNSGWNTYQPATNSWLRGSERTNIVDDPPNGISRAFVGESWVSIPLPGDAARPLTTASRSGSLIYPGLYFPFYYGDVGSFTTIFNESDVTEKLMSSLQPARGQGNDPDNDGALEVGLSFSGYVNIPDAAASTYDFRINGPNGRGLLFLENDIAANVCVGNGANPGNPDGTPCTLPSECTSNVCADRSRYTAIESQAVISWKGGTCTNSTVQNKCQGGARNGYWCGTVADCPGPGTPNCVASTTSCFDASECQWGTCSQSLLSVCKVGGLSGTYCRPGNSGDCRYCSGGDNANGPCLIAADCPGGTCTDPGAAACPAALENRGMIKRCRGTQPTSDWAESSGFGFAEDTPVGLCGGIESDIDGTTVVKDEGTCINWGPPVCVGASSPAGSSPPSGRVSFSPLGSGGIKARVCNASSPANAHRSCVHDEQCGGVAGQQTYCNVLGGGWYPFSAQYSQLNTARCSGNQLVACINDSICDRNGWGTCQSGSWCSGGTNNGQACGGVGLADCTVGGGSCVPQYERTCTAGTNIGVVDACWKDEDCDTTPSSLDGVCRVRTNTGGTLSSLQFQMKPASSGVWTTVNPNALMRNTATLNRASVIQEVPLSTLPGVAYRVSGKYKIEYYDSQFKDYQAVDPRKPTSVHAGISTRCKESTNQNRCGYDLNLFESSSTAGVTNGTCTAGNLNPTCATNADCDTGLGVGDGVCTARWETFSVVLTKQNRTAVFSAWDSIDSDDNGQSLEVICYSDVGARIWCDDIVVEAINDNAAAPSFDTVDVWAVGGADAAATSNYLGRNTVSIPAGSGAPAADSWLPQPSPSNKALYGITAADQHHMWAGGAFVAGQNAVLLRLSPGNVTSYAWTGTSESSTANPIGWIDFNCGNQGSCAGQPSAFGVSVDVDSVSKRCDNNLAKACTIDANCNDGNAGNDPDLCISGSLTGSAWLGTSDPTEQADFGRCLNLPPGRCTLKVCSNDPTKSCTTAAQCGGSPNTCQYLVPNCSTATECGTIVTGMCFGTPSYAACANDTDCDVITPGATCNLTQQCTIQPYCNGSVCRDQTDRSCSESSHCAGTCEKNFGIRCRNDADCKVSCDVSATDRNPIACRSTGWLSFDKAVTGTPPAGQTASVTGSPDFNSSGHQLLAQYDSADGGLRGWARIQYGRCSNNAEQSCFIDSQCSPGTCSYANAPSRSIVGVTDAEAGWVSLRGPAVAAGAGTYVNCQECNNDSATSECKFCQRSNGQSCTASGGVKCTGCNRVCSDAVGAAAINNVTNRCTRNLDCDDGVAANGAETCKAAGLCTNDTTGVATLTKCFLSTDCAAGESCKNFGSFCASCPACRRYGVSVDPSATKNFYGYAWSEDLGWIEASTLKLGGSAFFQTKFGDIYSRENIGSSQTPLAPGAPGGSPLCNATYRLIAGGTIQNVCSHAPLTAGSSFIQPNAPLFLLPRGSNQFTAKIGSFDITGLTAVASTAGTSRNKYGDPIKSSGAADLAAPSLLNGTAASLGGNVFLVNGDLTVNSAMTLLVGGAGSSGAGTVIVKGNVAINANIVYDAPQSITDRRQLPSFAIVAIDDPATPAVEGNLSIGPGVTQLVGAYYVENLIEDPSQGTDVKLTVKGLMLAKTFEFKRTFRGASDIAEPAEEIIYDGRLQANTPPGFQSVVAAFPTPTEQLP